MSREMKFTVRGDLDSEAEVAEMVRRFYVDVAQDDLLGPIFNTVARVDWSSHLPKMTQFWCRTLFGSSGYEGNPLRAHARVHLLAPFNEAHFQRWLSLFHETVELGWAGPTATRAVDFAERVAHAHQTWLSDREVRV